MSEFPDKSKMVIVVRKDLHMRAGKSCSQAAHAAVNAVLQSLYNSRLDDSDFILCDEGFEVNKPAICSDVVKDWLSGEFTKITVVVNSEDELNEIIRKAKEAQLNVAEIIDNGHTEFHGAPTKTCIAIGPDWSSRIDPITKDLKLF